MYIDAGATRGGMWTSLDDDCKIKLKVEPGEHHAELTFFGSFEVSLGLTEETVAQCRDLFTQALHDMRSAEDDQGQSWMHRAAPTD